MRKKNLKVFHFKRIGKQQFLYYYLFHFHSSFTYDFTFISTYIDLARAIPHKLSYKTTPTFKADGICHFTIFFIYLIFFSLLSLELNKMKQKKKILCFKRNIRFCMVRNNKSRYILFISSSNEKCVSTGIRINRPIHKKLD